MDIPDDTPEQLMGRFICQDDPQALNAIVSRFLAPALGVASQMLRDRAAAEDAVQETFLRLVRSRAQYNPSRPFSTWFYSILRNICRDLIRRRIREERLVTAAADEQARQTPPAPPAGGISAASILDHLPESERSVLTLRIIYDLPFDDIAAALDISVDAAKKRSQRGLRRLCGSGQSLKLLELLRQEWT